MPFKFIKKVYDNDPFVWRRSIEKFDRDDQQNPPNQDSILFIGSSSIRFWESLQEDMSPIPVINRGFGGSMVHQVTHYIDKIVLPYKPKAIFFYAGENDISGLVITRQHSSDEVSENYKQFCSKVHEALPDTQIYFISIKPPKRRIKFWAEMQRANALIEDFCKTDDRLSYIDITPVMQNNYGETRSELFRRDGIHLSPKGYSVWKHAIKPFVEKAFAQQLST